MALPPPKRGEMGHFTGFLGRWNYPQRSCTRPIAERFVRSVKSEALSQIILFGEKSLRHVLTEYLTHYHAERPHQGKGNVILFPSPRPEGAADGPIECRERLGGTLKFYQRKVA
jgi:hypothetical protein